MRYRNRSNGGAIGGLVALAVYLGIIIGVVWGYILNVLAIIATVGPIFATGLGVARVVGLFIPPLGVFLGWFY